MIITGIITLLHFAMVLFTVIVPFINVSKEIYILHAVWCFSLLIHWYFNNDTCGLTIIESYLTNKEIEEGFIYSIVSPVYRITSLEIRIITIILMGITVARVL